MVKGVLINKSIDPPRLLVVDDNRELASALCIGLRMDGYVVEQADSVKGAPEFLDTHTIDLVVSDWELPDGTGADVCELARRDNALLPVILISGVCKNEAMAQAVSRPNVCLEKPFSIPQLFSHVSALTGFKGNE